MNDFVSPKVCHNGLMAKNHKLKLKKKKKSKGWGQSSVIECLSNMDKVLASIPNILKNI
jgi:hypothetical protein